MISIIITIALFGFLLYAINTWLPMDGRVKQILNVVAWILFVLWLLNVFLGFVPYDDSYPLYRHR